MYQFLAWSFSTTVLKKCGNGSEDQIIVLVPSTQQIPVFVDRMKGMHMFELASCVQKIFDNNWCKSKRELISK